MRQLTVSLLLVLTACTPALREASALAAIDCGAGLVSLGQPAAPDFLHAASCWLERFTDANAKERAEPTEQLGRAVREASRAVTASQEHPDDNAAQREAAKAVQACERLSQ